jgi:hypothetical protein
MMKSLGMVLIGAAAIAFLVPRLHVTLPEGVSMLTLSTDILGGLFFSSRDLLLRSWRPNDYLASFAWLMWGGSRCGSPRNLFYSCR